MVVAINETASRRYSQQKTTNITGPNKLLTLEDLLGVSQERKQRRVHLTSNVSIKRLFGSRALYCQPRAAERQFTLQLKMSTSGRTPVPLMTGSPNYKIVVGCVSAIINRYKAVIEFNDDGIKQRALLKVEKFTSKPQYNPSGTECPISTYVELGGILKCLCHKFNDSGEHQCGWFVAEVQAIGLSTLDPNLISGVCPVMMNKMGQILQLDKRQGIISVTDEEDNQHNVLFLASKMYISGKRVGVKQSLQNILSIKDAINFDAVPLDAEENDNRFSWIATLAWRYGKPEIDYDAPKNERDPPLSAIKQVTRNPKSQFMRGTGKILRIVNPEYGIALASVNKKQTHWQTVLFHCSTVSLFKFNLSNTDLSTVFDKGDRIRFIAAAAPPEFNTQWVASYVGIDVMSDTRNLINTMLINAKDPDLAIESKEDGQKGKKQL